MAGNVLKARSYTRIPGKDRFVVTLWHEGRPVLGEEATCFAFTRDEAESLMRSLQQWIEPEAVTRDRDRSSAD